MNEGQENYILGQNVTDFVKGKEGRRTVVLSLRLLGGEFDALSDLAEIQGRTISQVAREAIRMCLRSRGQESYRAEVSFPNGTSVFFGDTSDATHWSGNPSPGNYESRIPVSAV